MPSIEMFVIKLQQCPFLGAQKNDFLVCLILMSTGEGEARFMRVRNRPCKTAPTANSRTLVVTLCLYFLCRGVLS